MILGKNRDYLECWENPNCQMTLNNHMNNNILFLEAINRNPREQLVYHPFYTFCKQFPSSFLNLLPQHSLVCFCCQTLVPLWWILSILREADLTSTYAASRCGGLHKPKLCWEACRQSFREWWVTATHPRKTPGEPRSSVTLLSPRKNTGHTVLKTTRLDSQSASPYCK